jgi:hypothetical protein
MHRISKGQSYLDTLIAQGQTTLEIWDTILNW